MSKHEEKIRSVVAAEMSWSASDVVVKPVAELSLPGCHFFAAHHATKPTHDVSSYAVLPNGEVVGQAKETAVDVITAACKADGASAKTWAELLVRFHPAARPGQVLYAPRPPRAEGEAPDARVKAPALEGGVLKFFTHNVELGKDYEVTAKIVGGKASAVKRTKLG